MEWQVEENHLVTGPSGGVEASLAAEAAAKAAINIRVTQPTPNHSPSGSLGSLGATAGAAAPASVCARVPAPEAIADALESIVPQQQSSSSNSDTLPSPALSNKSGMSSGRFVSLHTYLENRQFSIKILFLTGGAKTFHAYFLRSHL